MPRTTPTSRPACPTRLRWLAAPVAAAVIVGAYAVVPSMAGADAPPTLAPISARDLVAKVSQAAVPGLSGTITSQPHLGLPDLGQVTGDNGSFFTSLLTGSHTLHIWQAGSDVRLSLPSTLAEEDVVRHGDDVWVWQSEGHQASHLSLSSDGGAGSASHDDGTAGVTPTPQALADHFLGAADPTTRVFVRDTVTVAGRPAYELVLAPRSGTTLVADVVIAVDSATGLPLRVQVLSRDSGTPAIDVGFTSIDLSVPPASTFAFTPPPGATVTEAKSAADLILPGNHGTNHQAADQSPAAPANEAEPHVVGTGWDSIAVVDLGAGGSRNSGLSTLAKLGTSVQGSWGSGRLVTTSLVNVLLTDHNTLLVGSVPVAALEAAAAGH
jgi:outer membrane lipoprotein-sorting protein